MPASQSTFDEYVKYFQAKGYPEHAARAIVGNLTQESSLNPVAKNPKSGMRGLAQWDKRRYKGLESFAASKGKPPTDPSIQLDYIDHELNTTHSKAKQALLNTKDVASASRAFQNHYEIAPGQDDERRIQYALKGFDAKPLAIIRPEKNISPLVPKNYAFRVPEVEKPGTLQPVTKEWWGNTPIGQFTRTGRYDTSEDFSGYSPIKLDQSTASPKSTQRSSSLRNFSSTVLPFATNIANAVVKAPAPPAPSYGSPISLQRINMNNDRNEVERGTRSVDRFAEQQLDSQAAAQMKAYSNAQRFNQLSKVNQEERNANVGIANDEMKMNLGVSLQNLGMQRDYNNQLFDRKVAQQRFNQENLANASDKYSAIQDKSAMERSIKYSEDLKSAGDTYGAWARLQAKLRAEGKEGQRYGGKMRNGGILSNYGAGTMFRMNFKRLS